MRRGFPTNDSQSLLRRDSLQVFSIDRGGEFLKEMSTGRFNVPYFVKASLDFDRTYPKGSRDRYVLLGNCPLQELQISAFVSASS